MGGHGGLNILPQKRWNVYNYENREKVRLDEEAAAREEQLKQEQSRKRDAEFRIERLRALKGLTPQSRTASTSSLAPEPGSNHINLFEGLKVFDLGQDTEPSALKEGLNREKKRRKEEESAKIILPEDEKYRLGYGVAGKGVQTPWYLSRSLDYGDSLSGEVADEDKGAGNGGEISGSPKVSKKSVEELREERMKREKKEREKVRMLLSNNSKVSLAGRYKSSMR
ncbi:hypothetical protein AMTRI_Chr04g249400 [Amborella trichopoda]|uniref:uncharacterized protein LOC18435836 n=1 Tax=Amborella trichopoda TaxID=13333 RepID=UPI0005D346BF|nr:uncharacterized protein LOC18435836 [Amborella trichopoda]|eukprot:XP_011623993.1 uncharacterized protein LOC18435836 [Amborella trichopoda]